MRLLDSLYDYLLRCPKHVGYRIIAGMLVSFWLIVLAILIAFTSDAHAWNNGTYNNNPHAANSTSSYAPTPSTSPGDEALGLLSDISLPVYIPVYTNPYDDRSLRLMPIRPDYRLRSYE